MQNSVSFMMLSRANLLLLAIISVASLSIGAEIIPSEEHAIRSQPNLDEKLELYRFIRAVKSHYYQQTEQQIPEQLQLQQQQQQQQQQEIQRQNQINNYETADNSIGSNRGQSYNSVASKAPVFSQQVHSASREENESFGDTQPSSSSGFDSHPSRSSSSSSHSSSSRFHSSSGQSYRSKYHSPHASQSPARLSKTTPTSTLAPTTKHFSPNQDQSQVAHLKEVRIHTFPISQAVRYSNYVVVPSQSARLEESSGSSSSSSSSSSKKSSSSSSSTTTQEESSVVLAPPPTSTTTTYVNAPLLAPAPDCTPTLLQRLTVVRPVESTLVVNVPSSVSSSESSSQLVEQSTKEVSAEPPAVVPPICCVVEKRVEPLMTAKLVVPPKPSGHMREEHFHSETRSSREHSNGSGGLVSSSSSSSSSSRSSKSSSTSSTSQTSAALVAPVPVVTKHVTTVIRQPAPTVTIRAAPLIALAPVKESTGRTNNYSVDVDHHYSGPNVKYGYSIRQQSSEPETKGTLVGDQVVYLKRK